MRPPVSNPSVWCAVCGRGYSTEKSLKNHAYTEHRHTPKSTWFSAVDPTGKAQPAAAAAPESNRLTCPHCAGGHPFRGNERGLRIHLGRMHADLSPRDPPIVQPRTVTVADTPPIEGTAHVPTRMFPPAADRNNAVTLAGLPWMTWPATVEQCDDALNGIAIGVERTAIASPFWLSLRNYVTALRKRLAQKAAA